MTVIVPERAGFGATPRPDQVLLLPDESFVCGCRNIAEYGGFHASDRDGNLMAVGLYLNGEENPAWEGYYWCGGCGEIVIDARHLVFPPS
ncbi:hypothetical protein SAMN05421874_128125 [Nonomuraea maritima]|uniref:Uncharacterized protein n=1 Tax=Nonomuraea maritima TaxID=683260 RepID=A0A1G9MPX3_9ACTN|nr:hypothetical protein [Nonomuraea maritima]SDL76061.1 hypothetical protein SAMN05421874_128125 [Nonomuraea maritima]